jgi:hypothetical protein
MSFKKIEDLNSIHNRSIKKTKRKLKELGVILND